MSENAPVTQLKESISGSDQFLWANWLQETLTCFDCTTGTIHILEEGTDLLKLKAQVGVPEFLLPKMSVVPVGKGMAGIAAERKEAVQVCNLQTDESGVVRPGAKDTKVEGAITVPLLVDGALYGTLGIAKKEPYEFTEEEVANLLSIAGAMAKKVS
ncbi:MAG: GAF domain-containing protein [Lunatimonas sp.]|uniref:GAF domain-containing protein n=1 Tax=Lunatimonas sp. TaxID=2060141 RepID=UPI00263BBD14|nr:GAF domain-containing protein [Lunatimonas sp.]MCC5936634.1 GAF domain-containing protein [Lunatimonas sp.]